MCSHRNAGWRIKLAFLFTALNRTRNPWPSRRITADSHDLDLRSIKLAVQSPIAPDRKLMNMRRACRHEEDIAVWNVAEHRVELVGERVVFVAGIRYADHLGLTSEHVQSQYAVTQLRA